MATDSPRWQSIQGIWPTVLRCWWKHCEARDEFIRRAQVLTVYADMASSVDSNDQVAAAMASRARSLYGQVLAAFAFVDPELTCDRIGKAARLGE